MTISNPRAFGCHEGATGGKLCTAYCGNERHCVEGRADTPTPKPQAGEWTLTAPDGRRWRADSPIRCVSAEQRERVPASVALARIMREVDDDAATNKDSLTVAGGQQGEARPARAERERLFDGLLLKFQTAVANVARAHQEYMGKAMADDVYDRFATARDETIPALRHELRALATQAAPEASGERDTLRALLVNAREAIERGRHYAEEAALFAGFAWSADRHSAASSYRFDGTDLIARIDAALADGGAK